MIVIDADEIRVRDVILDIIGMDFVVSEVDEVSEDESDTVVVYDADDMPLRLFPEMHVALLYRPWPRGTTEGDMLDRILKAVEDASRSIAAAGDNHEARREALRRHRHLLQGAMDAYQLGYSEAAIAASDPRAPAPVPEE